MKKALFMVPLLLITLLQLTAFEVPQLSGRVNDYAGILSSSDENKIENYLAQIEAATSAQVAVLTIDSLNGVPLETYSLKVAESWALGSADEDNGLLLLVALEERKVRIEVGYGLEGLMTDAKSGYIIRNVIIPSFRSGDYSGGILQAVASIGGVISGSSDISEKALVQDQKRETGTRSMIPMNLIIFIIVFLIMIPRRIRWYRHHRSGGLLSALLLGSLMGRSHRHYGGRSSSSFGGGFGGGGFSGGGGGFGGGGASGGW